MDKKILITGATGHFGRAVINFLLQKGIPSAYIFALARDEAKAADLKLKGIQVKIGEYDNYPSLLNAFSGIDKLLLVSGNDMQNRGEQQKNVVNAAKETGVTHILYTSIERKNETSSSPVAMIADSHLETEKYIRSSGIPYTILRNNLYMDVLPWFIGETVLDNGVFFPAGATRASFASRSDMAEAAANILAGNGHENKDYHISNTEAVSFQDISTWIGQAANKDVHYTSPTQELYVETLTQAGVPADYIGMFTGFAEGIKQGEFEAADSDLEHLLGRKPMTTQAFLTQVYSSKS